MTQPITPASEGAMRLTPTTAEKPWRNLIKELCSLYQDYLAEEGALGIGRVNFWSNEKVLKIEEELLSHTQGVTEGREKERADIREIVGNNDVYLLPPGVRRVYGYSQDETTRIAAMCITNDITPPQEEPKLQQILNDQKEEV